MTTPDQSIEQEIQAKGKTAARVTPADIEAAIASESYFTAADGVNGASPGNPLLMEYVTAPGLPLSLLTFCVLVLRNGAKVVGFNHGSIDPANHDPEIGKTEARLMAIEKVWELEGYALRERLAEKSRSLNGWRL